jgi:sulfate transport system substrate-binding protein
VGVVAGLVALTGCATAGGGSSKSDEVSIVGFSVMKTANEQLLKDFQKTDAGKGVTFKTSYGASGDQSRAVIAGLDADEVHLSLEPDVTKLVDEKLVADDWKSGPNKGVLTQSVVAIVVRKGNPKGIKGWDDLGQAGRQDRHPQPGLLRFREVEHPRGVRPRARAGWHREGRAGLPQQVPRPRRRPPGLRQGRHHGVRGWHR